MESSQPWSPLALPAAHKSSPVFPDMPAHVRTHPGQKPIGSNKPRSSLSLGNYPISEIPALQLYLTSSICSRRQGSSQARDSGSGNIPLAPRSLPAKSRNTEFHRGTKAKDPCRKQLQVGPGARATARLQLTEPGSCHCHPGHVSSTATATTPGQP